MSAENSFRAAFERLKLGTPIVLGKGAEVSQNNVAREAGCDPSALRKSRYPTLIQEIQNWGESNTKQSSTVSARQKTLQLRSKTKPIKENLAVQISARDQALSLLVEADAKILELSMDIERLKAQLPISNIIPFK
ncbi:hypothetical protein [Pseudomonas sp. G5(2012)]|uniref:hypothetical protein n=1 Tax=Pseudomonas sp. G5(2012) TaxID=1268068 RepID=UPI0009DB73BF|nr:hypothetical protein [Pseudomonas sp. G5(2012)]